MRLGLNYQPEHSPTLSAAKYRVALGAGIFVHLAFVVVETMCGLLSHSMALLADAGHNLIVVFCVGISWRTVSKSARRAMRPVYRTRNSSVARSFAGAVSLSLITAALAWEAVQRINSPPPLGPMATAEVALLGVAVNGVLALFMWTNRKDLVARRALSHLAAGAAFSLAVTLGIAITTLTEWNWLEPLPAIGLYFIILEKLERFNSRSLP